MQSKIDPNWIIEQYNVQNRSFRDIAKELSVHPNIVRRIALANGVIPRDKSTARKLSIKSGRSIHPTQGKKRTEEEKNKIALGMLKSWDKMSEEKKEKRIEKAKENWKNRTEVQKEIFNLASSKGIHKSSKKGSKLEKFIYQYLSKAGKNVEFHKENLIGNHKLHLDLFLPDHLTVIEIDGPSHFLPIWGEEALLKTQRADTEKNGLILSVGFVIIRLKQISNGISKIRMKLIADRIITIVDDIAKNFPPLEKRLIEIEI